MSEPKLSTVIDSAAELNVFLLGKHLFNLCMLLMTDPLCGVKRLTNRETPKAGCTDSTCALQPNLDFLFHLARFSQEMDVLTLAGQKAVLFCIGQASHVTYTNRSYKNTSAVSSPYLF